MSSLPQPFLSRAIVRFARSCFAAFAWAVLLWATGTASAEPSVEGSAQVRPTEPVALAPQAQRHSIQQFGLTFLLGSSERTDSVSTEVYRLQGESAESWTQLLVYQRISLPLPLTTERYLAWLQQQLASRASPPKLRVLQQGKATSLFALHYPPHGGASEQVSLALLTIADPRRPNELHLVQFVLNPGRVNVDEMELHLRRWQARFQSQAASLEP